MANLCDFEVNFVKKGLIFVLRAGFEKKGKDWFKNSYEYVFYIWFGPNEKNKFLDVFNFSDICVIFAQICIF